MRRFVFVLLMMLGASALWAQSPEVSKVWEYRPAPGQFVNELPKYEDGDDAEAMALKAQESLTLGITLGGYGGYVIFSFDHPLRNVHGKYNLKVLGNSFYAAANPNPNAPRGGSAEPGIVMVSRDANGNGLPDDPWYELAGSEYNKPQTVHNYRITYTRPSDMSKAQDVPWTDNQGATGAVHANQFHKQPYYPLWLDEPSMTFEGTKLANNAVDESGKGSYWVLYCFPWGYADNEVNTSQYANFKLDWAVDADGNHVNLEEVHFVKVFTAVNQEAGWLGETSTEVMGALDWNMLGGYDTVTICGNSYTWNGKTYVASGDYYHALKSKAKLDSSVTLHLTLNPVYNIETEVTACGVYNWQGSSYDQSGSYTKTLQTGCGCDSTVTLHLTLVENYDQTVNAVSCDGSYEWEGTVYTESGSYTKTLTSVGGCDSVVTLNLSMGSASTNHVQATVCGDSYTWEGQTYTMPGQYTRIYSSAQGCDSIVTLHLSFADAVYHEFSAIATACSGYEMGGETYWKEGDYTAVLTSATGCDSIVTLHLSMRKIDQTINVTACGCYMWDGETYTASKTITKKYVNAAGCDSTVTLKLTIATEARTSFSTIACGSYVWHMPTGDTTITESGQFTKKFASVGGCDSTVTLNLTIKTPVTHEFTATACGAYWWNGIAYAATGDYQQVFRARSGCDSTVTMHLTIDQPTLIEKDITVCGSYVHGGVMYMRSGLQTAVYGCDSTVRLNLTINPIHQVAFGQIACGSHEWEGETYTASGIYPKMLTSSKRCDSLVTMDLQVLQPRYNIVYDTVCGSGTMWNGLSCPSSGVYTHAMEGAAHNGCDSIAMLYLEVMPVPVVHLADTVDYGAGYTRHGFNLSASEIEKKKIHSHYLKTAQGCDSIVYVHLEVRAATTTATPALLAESVSLHPNPTSGLLQIDGALPFSRVEVYNATGHLVHSRAVGQHRITLNLHHLPAGVYTLRLSGRQGCATRRFVKM